MDMVEVKESQMMDQWENFITSNLTYIYILQVHLQCHTTTEGLQEGDNKSMEVYVGCADWR